jgi:hypothetical protein
MTPCHRFWCAILLLLLFVIPPTGGQGEAAMDLFPFLIDPRQELPSNITDVSHWLEKPAGKNGFVRVENGRFITGDGQHIRFLGINLCFHGNFPDHGSAQKLARQLARYGINLVRFHHMDTSDAPRGIWQAGSLPRRLDPQQLDRLDYFIAQLKENGIYSNLNLHVSRTMLPQEGFPEPESRPKYDKGLAMYHPDIIAHQKEYARALLTHRNPYTGNRYVEEPALAMVEITNEDGLMRLWEQGSIDTLPDRYQRPLDVLWQKWLENRYGTTEALRSAWGGAGNLEAGGGPELVANGDLSQGTTTWNLETDALVKAAMKVVADAGPFIAVPGEVSKQKARSLPALQVQVLQKGEVSWRPQFHHTRLKLEAGRKYLVSFWVKTDRQRQVGVNVRAHHDPWQVFWSSPVLASTDWQYYQYGFQIPTGAVIREGRVGFTSLEAGATYWVAGVSVRQMTTDGIGLPDSESFPYGIARPLRAQLGLRTEAVQRDYLAFLWDVETAYFSEMHRFIREELGAGAMVSGTQVRWSPPAIQAKLDYVDAHAYWNHPTFPGQPWDSRDWYVTNNSMAASTNGGNISRLATTRVAGKPYVISEYNHPAPITFSSEAFLLTGAYGAFQDWDGLVPFAWTHNNDYWPLKIDNYFDIKAHPTKLVTLPAVAAMFVRGDVSPGGDPIIVPLNEDTQRRIVAERNTGAVAADATGVPALVALERRLALAVEQDAPGGSPRVEPSAPPQPGPVVSSDTGQLSWDLSGPGKGVVLVDSPRSKAMIGYGGGRLFNLSGVTLAPGETRQDGWAAISLTAMDGSDFSSPGRILLTATGYVENAGMRWEALSENRITVRDRWGSGPPLVEGIPARIQLPVSHDQVHAYALDQSGERRQPLPVLKREAGHSMIEIGPQYLTLWYEIEIIPAQ